LLGDNGRFVAYLDLVQLENFLGHQDTRWFNGMRSLASPPATPKLYFVYCGAMLGERRLSRAVGHRTWNSARSVSVIQTVSREQEKRSQSHKDVRSAACPDT
jgi:hypothetical protein